MSSYIPHVVYSLCSLTCLLCAVLLWRSYRESRQRLLFVLGLCFAGLTVNNILLPIDLIVLSTDVDLSVLRGVVGLVSMTTLLVVLIWEAL